MTSMTSMTPNHTNLLSDDDLFGDRPLAIFIPRKGGHVYIRPPRADEAMHYFRRNENETDEQAEDKRRQLIALCLCDEEGNPRLQPGEYDKIKTMGADVYLILTREVTKLISGEVEVVEEKVDKEGKEGKEETSSVSPEALKAGWSPGTGESRGESREPLGNAGTGGS